MGYRSQMVFKTTTEGYLVIKKKNDSIEELENKPLGWLNIEIDGSGCYKISHDSIKWYESYPAVATFMELMDRLDEQEIPYKFIRIGEDTGDIDVRENWVDDMPDEIEDLSVYTTIEDSSSYTEVPNPDKPE